MRLWKLRRALEAHGTSLPIACPNTRKMAPRTRQRSHSEFAALAGDGWQRKYQNRQLSSSDEKVHLQRGRHQIYGNCLSVSATVLT